MKTNKEIIKEYKNFRLFIENKGQKTVKSEMFILITLDKYVKNKSFKQLTESELVKYLNQKKYSRTTKDMRIIFIKKFYRWLYDIKEGESLPDCVRRIKTSVKNTMQYYNDTLYRERIITEQEYQKLIDFSNKIMHKAMIETLYLFGCRASELLSINSNDVEYNGTVTKITIRDSKNMPRDAIYSGRAKYLLKWAETYQHFKGQKDKPLWTNYQKNKHNRYTINGLEKAIKVISKRAGIERRITPHDFRHTAVSNSRKKGIPMTHIETNFGYNHGSRMMQVYDHNKIKDFEEYLKQRAEETKPTYELLEKQKKTIEEKHEKEINSIKEELNDLKWRILKNSHDKDESLLYDRHGKSHVIFEGKAINVSTFEGKKKKIPKDFELTREK